MAFPEPFGGGGGPFALGREQTSPDEQFDIFAWHTKFLSCLKYFLDHAQHTGPVQAVAAFVNIQLPFQKTKQPILSSRPPTTPPAAVSPGPGMPGSSRGGGGGGAIGSSSSGTSHHHHAAAARAAGAPEPMAHATLIPYIRRLVATGFDYPAVLHGFFGDHWQAGIGPLHEAERRNYLFAAKSETWLKVKNAYDMGDDQAVPYLKPLQNVTEKEILGAESYWSEWLAMQDWMLGPRAPEGQGGGQGGQGRGGGVNVKREERG